MRVDIDMMAVGGEVSDLILRGLPRGREALVDRHEVLDVGDGHRTER